MVSVGTLGMPAMLAAGLASSPHCALMCGALFAGARPGVDASRHAGRLAGYAAIGALAGGAGHLVLRAVAWTGPGQAIRLLLVPLMIGLLVRSMRRAHARGCCAIQPVRPRHAGHARRLAAGFVGAFLPCPLLLAAAGYAMLSGGMASGAALMLAFGLGTTPAVQAGAWIWARGAGLRIPGPAIVSGALAAVLLAAVVGPSLAGWCVAR